MTLQTTVLHAIVYNFYGTETAILKQTHSPNKQTIYIIIVYLFGFNIPPGYQTLNVAFSWPFKLIFSCMAIVLSFLCCGHNNLYLARPHLFTKEVWILPVLHNTVTSPQNDQNTSSRYTRYHIETLTLQVVSCKY